MKIHDPDPRENRKRVEALEKALGDGVKMMVDVNQKLDVLGAIRQAQVLEDLDLVWYEEPVLADDLAACAEVARAIKIPVATGENITRASIPQAIERRAATYLMPACAAPRVNERLASAPGGGPPVAVSPSVHELSGYWRRLRPHRPGGVHD